MDEELDRPSVGLSAEAQARRRAFARAFAWVGALAGLGWAVVSFGHSADWRDPVVAAACFGPLGAGAGLFVGHMLWAAGHEDDGSPVRD
jgi:hypothetical protein